MTKKVKMPLDTSFMVPVNLFSPDREGLDFIQSILCDRGWVSPWGGWVSGAREPSKDKSPGYRRDFWVPEKDLEIFKEELVSACLPFNLEPHYLRDNVIAITEIKGGLNG